MEERSMLQDNLLSLLAEIALDQVIRKHRKQQLYVEIDHALANGDQQRFLELTGELNFLNSMEVPLEEHA